MPPADREPTPSALRVAQDLGSIKEGVRNLTEGQKRVDKKITGLQRNVADLVTRADCKQHRNDVTEKIDMAVAASAQQHRDGHPAGPRPAFLERAGKQAGAIAAILSLVTMIIVGVVVVARFVASLERAIDADRQAQNTATKVVLQELRKRPEPAIVYQSLAPLPPDAGAPRKRKRRRGRPRNRSTE